jgi:hypothetical protein
MVTPHRQHAQNANNHGLKEVKVIMMLESTKEHGQN